MIRVLHVIVSLDRGGAESALLELIRERAPDVQQSVCGIKANGVLKPAFEDQLQDVYSLAIDHVTDARVLPRLLRLVASVRPTILHTWMFHANVLGRAAGALSRIPVICSVRSLELDKPRWRIALDRASNRLATQTVAVSCAAAEVAVRRDGARREQLTVIPNGVDLPPQPAGLEGFNTGHLRVGAVGRLEPVKDHVSLLRGFAALAQVRPNVSLEIVGEGSQRSMLEGLANELEIVDRIALPGEIPEARERMLAWDVFVQPSLAEGMPRAVLEAMAAGLPVVATNVGGVPEALGSSGLLVPPRQPEALGSALIALAGDPERARAFGLAARQRVADRFSRASFVNAHLDLYRKVARATGG